MFHASLCSSLGQKGVCTISPAPRRPAQDVLARIMHARHTLHTLQLPRPQRRPVPANLIAGLIRLSTKGILTPAESPPRLLEGTHAAAEGGQDCHSPMHSSRCNVMAVGLSCCPPLSCASRFTLHASPSTLHAPCSMLHAPRLTLRAASDSVHVSSPESGRGTKSDAHRESRPRIQSDIEHAPAAPESVVRGPIKGPACIMSSVLNAARAEFPCQVTILAQAPIAVAAGRCWPCHMSPSTSNRRHPSILGPF